MKFSEYTQKLEAMAADGKQFRAVDGDIVTMLSLSYQITGDIIESVMGWAANEGVEQGSREWCETVDAARFVRKYRMAERIKSLQDELDLLEAQESGDD